jgi:hypothetical protein
LDVPSGMVRIVSNQFQPTILHAHGS